MLNCPVTTSLEGKSTFNETHPLEYWFRGHATPKAVYHFINEADLIFGIGCSFAITSLGTRMPDNKKVIHATLDPMDLNKDVPAQLGLIGDAKLTLRALIDELKELDLGKAEARRESTPADIRKVKDAWMAEWLPKLTSGQEPMTPYRVIYELNKLVDKQKVVITHDAAVPVISSFHSGKARHRCPTLAGARPRSLDMACRWRWGQSWPNRTTFASMLGRCGNRILPAWISKRRSVSAFQYFPFCLITSAWPWSADHGKCPPRIPLDGHTGRLC